VVRWLRRMAAACGGRSTLSLEPAAPKWISLLRRVLLPPPQVEQRSGKILNLGSGLGYTGLPTMSHYSGERAGPACRAGGGAGRRRGGVRRVASPCAGHGAPCMRPHGAPHSAWMAPTLMVPLRTSPALLPALARLPAAVKHAVRSYTDMLRIELAPFGVQVCFVAPG
jgi:NAD(P)-dependent dehydrogenase (short-subunit alcohol dehydrogenase family)